ncbi:MAG: GspH/FimT family protein [Nitrospirae bacterium]|nr:GspH/FimT family protein [Nitrospirota bacterium]
MLEESNGITLLELLIVITIIGIITLVSTPLLGQFKSNYSVRSAATDLIQNMRLARAMAIKENREYLIVFDTANNRYLMGFDGDGDRNLTTLNMDTFGICKDIDGDRLPNDDTDANGDNVPDCVMVVNLQDYGADVEFGTMASENPDGSPLCKNAPVCFGSTEPPRADFNPSGSAGNLGSVYLQHAGRGYSYVVRISNHAGAASMWKWKGEKGNLKPSQGPDNSQWIEVR